MVGSPATRARRHARRQPDERLARRWRPARRCSSYDAVMRGALARRHRGSVAARPTSGRPGPLDARGRTSCSPRSRSRRRRRARAAPTSAWSTAGRWRSPIVGAAALRGARPRTAPIADARIALTAVAPTIVRAPEAEQGLRGAQPTPEALAAAAGDGRARRQPDQRRARLAPPTARRCVETICRRALQVALRRARGERVATSRGPRPRRPGGPTRDRRHHPRRQRRRVPARARPAPHAARASCASTSA